MIRSESSDGEISDHAERILEQTRNITHVVTEFLKFARPLDISDEPVELQPLIGRAIDEIASGGSRRFGSRRRRFWNRRRRRRFAAASDFEFGAQWRRSMRRQDRRAGCRFAEKSFEEGDAPSQRITVQDNGSGISAEAMPKFISSVFHDESAWNRVRVRGRPENYFAARRFDRSKEPPVRWCSLYRYATRSPSPGELKR